MQKYCGSLLDISGDGASGRFLSILQIRRRRNFFYMWKLSAVISRHYPDISMEGLKKSSRILKIVFLLAEIAEIMKHEY